MGWDTFAGGTSAAPGKIAYRMRAGELTYTIDPLSSSSGHHLGYGVVVFGAPGPGAYKRITRAGTAVAFNGWHADFRSPNEAKAAVARHLAAQGQQRRRGVKGGAIRLYEERKRQQRKLLGRTASRTARRAGKR